MGYTATPRARDSTNACFMVSNEEAYTMEQIILWEYVAYKLIKDRYKQQV